MPAGYCGLSWTSLKATSTTSSGRTWTVQPSVPRAISWSFRVRRLGVGGDEARHDEPRHGPAQRREALAGRPVQEVLAVEMEDVEEERGQGKLAAQAGDVELAAEAAHGDLERQRRAVRPQRDDLAVEDELARRQGLDGLDQLGHGRGDVVPPAREDADLLPGLVDLDAGAVQLQLEGGLAEPLQGLGDVPRRRGEHGLEGAQQLEAETVEPGPPLDEHGPRHGRQLAGEHERPAHVAGRR